MRTTIDIDGPVLKDLKRLQKREGKTLGKLASELLELALRDRRPRRAPPPTLRWTARKMGARLDLDDRVALAEILDQEDVSR